MTTTARDAKDIAAEWAAAWNATDQTRLAALFTPEGTYTDLAIGKSFEGRDAITGFKAVSDAAIENLTIQILNVFGDGDQIAIESVYSGHFRGAPYPFAVRGTTTQRVIDGLIATNTDNYSVATVLAESGLPADWTPPANGQRPQPRPTTI